MHNPIIVEYPRVNIAVSNIFIYYYVFAVTK